MYFLINGMRAPYLITEWTVTVRASGTVAITLASDTLLRIDIIYVALITNLYIIVVTLRHAFEKADFKECTSKDRGSMDWLVLWRNAIRIKHEWITQPVL